MLEPQHYREVAALHAEGIKDGFLSSLGMRFLTLLYRAIDEADQSLLIVELKGDRVVGFVAGGAGMGPIYRRMLRQFPQLASALAPQMLNPRKLRGLIDILTKRGADDEAQTNGDLPEEELFSIVVAPEMRGQGIADKLYRELAWQLAQNGSQAFKIMVGENLHPAHSFYLRMGAEPQFTGTFHKGARSVIYVQKLEG